jgi:hypothetical protein
MKVFFSQAWWLTSVISATREAEIERITVRDTISTNKSGVVVHAYNLSYLEV